ncbi:CU044_5270 family protein, partial [Actinoplanes octamycinicus]
LAVAVIAVTVRSRTPDGAMVLVAQTLNTAADAPAQAVDEPVPAGAYRYIAVHTMTTVSENELTVLAGIKSELWVPADPAGEWFRLESDTGEWVPLVGTEEQLKAARLGPEKSPPTRESGPCGAFTPGLSDMCTAPGTWQVPTAAFLAGLPRDPERLFDRLRDDTDGHGRDPDQEVLVYAADALRSGLVPADLRSALYRALAHLPTLRITERFATLDGRTGTALGIDAAGEQQEIVIDPATGAFIGERTRRTEATGSLPAGTVIHSSSVTYGIAKQPWSPPTT